MTTQQPEALRLANILRGIDARSLFANEKLSAASEALESQHARITELESQLAQRFDAADMATAALAQPAPENIRGILARCRDFIDTTKAPAYPAGADLADEIDVLLAAPQPSHAVQAVISDVDKTLEETFAPAQPAAQQGAAYAATPTSNYAGRVYEEGFLLGTCPLYTADQMRAFADATCALRAAHGQAPVTADSVLEGKP